MHPPEAQAVFITGLKRSGTTIFWESFRKDPDTLCYDEPFHPSLWEGKRTNGKGTWTELAQFWSNIDDRDQGLFKPILADDELDLNISRHQIGYLRQLVDSGRHVVIDEVRAWNKLPDLFPNDRKIFCIHLLRDPLNWVTAHLLPNAHFSWSRPRDIYQTFSFFWRRGDYNNWRYQYIVENALDADHSIFKIFQRSCKEIRNQTALIKLLAFWWAANVETHKRLRSWHNGRVLTLTLDEFTAHPEKCLTTAYEMAGWDLPPTWDFGFIKPVRPRWKPTSPNWHSALTP